MAESKFVYVTFIRSTQKKVWKALQEPEFTRQYWVEVEHVTTWKKGAPWKMVAPGGLLLCSGEVLEYDPFKRYAVSWRHEKDPEIAKEGHSRMECDLEQQGSTVKVTITHTIAKPESQTIASVSKGWPFVLASLKSFLETGQPIEEARKWPRGN
jgi:uncharacterized protein YndB with AHSA1/START domain